jgi:thiamine biosynthesis lipoprotein
MNRGRRQVLMGAGSVALIVALPGTAQGAGTRVMGGPAFGSYWRVTLPQGTDAGRLKPAIEEVIHAVDALMSPYRKGSEISRFNNSRDVGWVPVSVATRRVMDAGLRVARLTGGAFDPTVGPAVGRLGFGPITGAMVGNYTAIATNGDAVRKYRPGLTFDPCGIAKGYALDRIARRLDALGESAYLVELGGEVFARGRHPFGRPWMVGVERPAVGAVSFQRIVRLDGAALATSGDVVNSYKVSGRRLSHIIDPASGAPVDHAIASVSVIAPKAMTADALATGLMAMGPDRGMDLARSQGLGALFILRGDSGFKEIATPAFKAHVVA